MLRGPRLPVATDHRHNDDFDVRRGRRAGLLDDLGAVARAAAAPRRPGRPDPGDHRAGRGVGRRCAAPTCRTPSSCSGRCSRCACSPTRTPAASSPRPTTSLPEDFGGERNWDYRYCWLRDAALTLSSLIAAGYTEEALVWRAWLLRAVAGDPEDLQIMYAVDGARRLPEHVLDHLPGYEGSAPVRIGNGAVEPAPGRRPRRGDDRPREHPAQPAASADDERLGAAAGAGPEPRQDLAGARPRAVGDPRPAATVHALARHGVGGVRPRRPGDRGVRARRARWRSGAGCATRSTTR